MYINVRRFQELAQRNYSQVHSSFFDPRMPLLKLEGSLAGFVLEYERVLKNLDPEAISLASLNTKTDLERSVGQLISFTGKFRSKNAPRLRNGLVPEYHPTGDLNKDHIVYANYPIVRLILPLDSLWYASHSAI